MTFGFPLQPYSASGSKLGCNDVWDQLMPVHELIKLLWPPLVVFENESEFTCNLQAMSTLRTHVKEMHYHLGTNKQNFWAYLPQAKSRDS